MQGFARWNNLSETTFLLPPSPEAAAAGADYRVRIFTPGGELPFAGHPTLGSCRAWLESGGQPKQAEVIVQQCAKGLVRIRRDGTQLAFAAPELQRSKVDATELEAIAQALGLPPKHIIASQMLDNGPVWLGLLLDSADTVLQLEPDHRTLKTWGRKVGVAAVEQAQAAPGLIARSNREARAFGTRASTESAEPVLEVRAFAAPMGIHEDPVTGSLNASLAQWLIADGHMPERYTAHQGTCLGRRGRVALQRDAENQVWVGGDVVTCISGQVLL
jgi:PhzF family phenazine biosynthesis protein